MKPKATHTSFHKGTRVFVILRDGSSFRDKYVERTARAVKFKIHGLVLNKSLRSVSIAR